ncbi:hypothetical protein LTR37_003592 [Vermiconidia calcicola]|uniref:Uncharacterized protein n=1 Tax=Vermiconidia calcicola TaxID=1690605 RepID=A0ACC3NP64_9PEZI|nr:hypothetical protein LTR37_003592 [Vermiconidia calcicola]
MFSLFDEMRLTTRATARLALNYKGIPYRTEWLKHQEIAPKLKELGIPPNEPAPSGPPQSPYTVPAIQLPGGPGIMDSAAIAAKLESIHPEPSLHLDNGLVEKVGPLIGKVAFPLLPVFMPRIARDIILEEYAEWFAEARAQKLGMPLDELERTRGGDQAWEAARPGLIELTQFLAEQKRDDGPFILGSQVCYADFLIVSMMEALRRIGQDLFERFIQVSGDHSLRKLHEACQRWMRSDQ